MITERMQQLAGVTLNEGEDLGYFFKYVYKPLIKELKAKSPKHGFELADWIHSKAINTTTFFFEGERDFEITFDIVEQDGEEVEIGFYATLDKQKIFTSNTIVTGNMRRDVQAIVDKILEFVKRV